MGNKDDITVSICCITYNQEKFIESAIKSFLSQKTDFKYEILIHDDASTDNTPLIIKQYADKFPSIIKPVFQKQNQFSLGKSGLNILEKMATGKYIALCEGDDYWIDNSKLQKQVDYMERHKSCSLCFTDAYILNIVDNNTSDFFDNSSKKILNSKQDFTLNDSYSLPFIPAASLLFVRENMYRLPDSFWTVFPKGDLKVRLYMGILGYAHYIDVKTCVYRTGISSSAMSEWKRESREKVVKRELKNIEMIDEVNVGSNRVYSSGLSDWKDFEIDYILRHAYNHKILKEPSFRTVWINYPRSVRIKIWLSSLLNEKCYIIIKKIKERI